MLLQKKRCEENMNLDIIDRMQQNYHMIFKAAASVVPVILTYVEKTVFNTASLPLGFYVYVYFLPDLVVIVIHKEFSVTLVCLCSCREELILFN